MAEKLSSRQTDKVSVTLSNSLGNGARYVCTKTGLWLCRDITPFKMRCSPTVLLTCHGRLTWECRLTSSDHSSQLRSGRRAAARVAIRSPEMCRRSSSKMPLSSKDRLEKCEARAYGLSSQPQPSSQPSSHKRASLWPPFLSRPTLPPTTAALLLRW